MISRLKRSGAVFGAAALVAAGALALSGTAQASTVVSPAFNGGVITYTSNGEAGWYTNQSTRLNEIHAVVDLPSTIESTGNNGGIGLQLGEYVGTAPLVSRNPNDPSSVTSGDTCQVAQVGLRWDGTGYQVWVGVGELQFDPTNADTISHAQDANPFNGGNGNACTQGGALNTTVGETYTGGYDQVTAPLFSITNNPQEILGTGAGPGAQRVDLQPGQAVFLKLEIGTGHNGLHLGVVKGTAQALSATIRSNGSYSYSALTSQEFKHIIVPPSFRIYNGGYANAGTVFDNSLRSVFASGGGVREARFDGLRAADGIHKVNGVWTDNDQVLSAYGEYGAESTSNGQPGGGITAQPGPLGYSVFTVNVGNLVAAG